MEHAAIAGRSVGALAQKELFLGLTGCMEAGAWQADIQPWIRDPAAMNQVEVTPAGGTLQT